MMQKPLGLVFTIEVDDKPTLTFEARQLREAAELSKEEWLRADLNTLNSNGIPLQPDLPTPRSDMQRDRLFGRFFCLSLAGHRLGCGARCVDLD
jgi:hypothetical protein